MQNIERTILNLISKNEKKKKKKKNKLIYKEKF